MRMHTQWYLCLSVFVWTGENDLKTVRGTRIFFKPEEKKNHSVSSLSNKDCTYTYSGADLTADVITIGNILVLKSMSNREILRAFGWCHGQALGYLLLFKTWALGTRWRRDTDRWCRWSVNRKWKSWKVREEEVLEGRTQNSQLHLHGNCLFPKWGKIFTS